MSASPASSAAAVHWAVALDQIAQRFTRAEPRRFALAYFKGLLIAARVGWRPRSQGVVSALPPLINLHARPSLNTRYSVTYTSSSSIVLETAWKNEAQST